MVQLKIVINSKEDAAAGKPIIPGSSMKQMREGKVCTIGILEGGMASGKTSLMFLIENADGTISYTQCSAAQFEALIGAFRGAVQRFSK